MPLGEGRMIGTETIAVQGVGVKQILIGLLSIVFVASVVAALVERNLYRVSGAVGARRRAAVVGRPQRAGARHRIPGMRFCKSLLGRVDSGRARYQWVSSQQQQHR